MYSFGERLAYARERKRITKKHLCELLSKRLGKNLNRNTYASWERLGTQDEISLRSYPSPDVLRALSEILDVSIDALVLGYDIKSRDQQSELVQLLSQCEPETQQLIIKLLRKLAR